MVARTKVTEIAHKGTSALVEYFEEGRLKRRVVPLPTIVDDTVDDKVLANGAPYGIDLTKLDLSRQLRAFPTMFETVCHNSGLWTKEDFLGKPTLVMSCLQAALNFDVSAVLDWAAQQD